MKRHELPWDSNLSQYLSETRKVTYKTHRTEGHRQSRFWYVFKNIWNDLSLSPISKWFKVLENGQVGAEEILLPSSTVQIWKRDGLLFVQAVICHCANYVRIHKVSPGLVLICLCLFAFLNKKGAGSHFSWQDPGVTTWRHSWVVHFPATIVCYSQSIFRKGSSCLLPGPENETQGKVVSQVTRQMKRQ